MATAPAKKRAQPQSSNGESRRAATTSKATVAATPWGAATVLEEISVPQRAGDKRFAVVVQLLETKEGERLIRFAYTTSSSSSESRGSSSRGSTPRGTARRGPVTMRARDLERLRAALERAPVLGEVLRL
jgi:hypothetical protein